MEPIRLKQDIRIKDFPAEDRRSLVGFFELLIKVDKRLNPDFYKMNRADSGVNKKLSTGKI